MFSGIVEEAASVESIQPAGAGATLRVRSSLDLKDVRVGDSIAIEGVCLTVVSRDGAVSSNGAVLTFDLAEETIRRSTLGRLKSGQRVNLERSLRIGDRIAGHFVFGHVDGTTVLKGRRPEGNSECLTWSLPNTLRPYLAPKGSVALAGVSLTVGEVEDDTFRVYVIPHTAAVTTLRDCRVGDSVNVEIDMLARYVERALATRDPKDRESISHDFLAAHGYVAES